MSAEKFRQVTDATQADFLAHREEVISEHVANGQHPNHEHFRRLLKLWQENGTPEKLAHLHLTAMSHPKLAEVVGQYIDPSGEPKAAVNENGAVKLGDNVACFGRQCGFQKLCWTQCSLGPSRHANGALPEGASEGQAVPTHPKGYAMGEQPVSGVLCQVADPTSGQPRHRSDACGLLSTFLHVFAIPPSPTGNIQDTLYDLVGPVMDHVENRLEAEKATAQPVAQPPQAPPAAPPQQQAQPTQQQPPQATPPQGTPPSAPPSAPPQAPAAPPSAPPAAPPQGGMAPSSPPGTPPAAPPQATPPAPPAEEPAEGTLNQGPVESYFDDTTIEQEWELRALRHALIHSPDKPKSEEAVDNMIERNNKTYKKCRGALFKACASRDLTTGNSLKTDKLKAEYWPEDIEVPQDYHDSGVPEETTEAPPAVDTPSETPPAAPPSAPPEAPPAQGAVLAIKPQAPDQPQQRVDEERDEDQPEKAPEQPVPEPEKAPEQPAPEPEKVPEPEPTTQAVEPEPERAPEPKPAVDVEKAIAASGDVAGMFALAEAINNYADAYRERTMMMRAQNKQWDDMVEQAREDAADGNFELHPVEEKPAKKSKASPKKKPTKKKSQSKKKASSSGGKKSSKASKASGVKAHPKHPSVQKEPCKWQPGKRGRPPKGVTRKKNGDYKFPRTWKEINGKWHEPMPK